MGWCASKESPVHEGLYIGSDLCRFHACDSEVLLLYEKLKSPHVKGGEVSNGEVGEIQRDESEGLMGCADIQGVG